MKSPSAAARGPASRSTISPPLTLGLTWVYLGSGVRFHPATLLDALVIHAADDANLLLVIVGLVCRGGLVFRGAVDCAVCACCACCVCGVSVVRGAVVPVMPRAFLVPLVPLAPLL